MKKTLSIILFLLLTLCVSAQEVAEKPIRSADDFSALLNSGKDIDEMADIMKASLHEVLGEKSDILEAYIASLEEAKEGTDLNAFTQLVVKMVDCMKKVEPSPDWDVLKSAITSAYLSHQCIKKDE